MLKMGIEEETRMIKAHNNEYDVHSLPFLFLSQFK